MTLVGNNVLGVLGAEADAEVEKIIGEDNVESKWGGILPAIEKSESFHSAKEMKWRIPGNKGFKLGLVNEDVEAAFLRVLLALLRVETPVLPAADVVVDGSFRLLCLVAGAVTAGVGVEAGAK